MRSYVTLLPAILSAYYLFHQWTFHPHVKGSPPIAAKGFLYIYLPVLLLLPQHYHLEIPVLPNVNFGQAALIPIALVYFILPEKATLRIRRKTTLLDLLVVAYALMCVISEYYNTGMDQSSWDYRGNLWRTVLSRKALNVVVPYYLARQLISPNGLTDRFVKIMAVALLIALFSTAYEWRFVVSLHNQVMAFFFPDQVENWIPQYRYGLVRIMGPFPHPIQLGTAVASALLLNHWLTRNRFWKKGTFLPLNSYWKGIAVGTLLFGGLILTFSRGPLYSLLFSFFILGLGYVRNRWGYLCLLGFVFTAICALSLYMIGYYSGIDRDLASTQLESTAIYRVNLIDAYAPYYRENFWMGWGSATWPKATGMRSIDNEYLFLLITHGAIALFLFCACIFVASVKLLRSGMRIPGKYNVNRSLASTLLAVLFLLSVTYITVFSGLQMEALTFVLLGLSQGFLNTRPAQQPYPVQPRKRKPAAVYA